MHRVWLILRRLWHLFRRESQQSQHNQRSEYVAEPPVFRLPIEILDQIFSLLSTPNQVCLALSCKGYYQLFHPTLRIDSFRFPRVLSRNRKTFHQQYLRQRKFLIQLEDSRWAFCIDCLKLHPRRKFHPFDTFDHRPLRRWCEPCAGIVDLCPSVALTIRDRVRIVEYLTGSDSGDRLRQSPTLLLLKGLEGGRRSRHLSHECLMVGEDTQTKLPLRIQIKMTLSYSDATFNHEGAGLNVTTRYEMYPSEIALKLEPWLFCHDLNWLEIMSDSHRLKFRWSDCTVCEVHAEELTGSDGVVVVQTTRNLGRGKWRPASWMWYRHCRPDDSDGTDIFCDC